MSDEQTIEQREGSTRYFIKTNSDTAFILARHCYEFMLEAWMKGETFYKGVDRVGDPMVVKLADVHMIGLCTPKGMARWEEDMKIERTQKKKRELIEGDNDE